MIIRGATVAEDARPLQAPRTERSLASSIALSVREPLPAHLEEDVSHTLRTSQPMSATPTEPELNFEKVAAWLAVQDGETRTACASLLGQELTLVYENAKVEGHKAGEAAGLQKAREVTALAIEQLRTLAVAAEGELDREVATVADGCVDIVVAAFAKLAGTMLVTREAAIGAVEQVLAHVKEARELTIRVNSADVAALTEVVEELTEAFGGRKLEIVGDARVELGGCIVESKLGSLDGRFESQLRELFETLRAAKLAAGERA